MRTVIQMLTAIFLCAGISQASSAAVCDGYLSDSELATFSQTGRGSNNNGSNVSVDERIAEVQHWVDDSRKRATGFQGRDRDRWLDEANRYECMADALRTAKRTYEQRSQTTQAAANSTGSSNTSGVETGRNTSSAKKDLIYFPPVTAKCIKKGEDEQGRPAYTNICNATLMVGWCYLEQTSGKVGLCEANNSEFSRTGKNYVTQDSGMKPGTSFTVVMPQNGTHFTFLVACENGFPLIESFNTKTITRSSKARMTCWRFKKARS